VTFEFIAGLIVVGLVVFAAVLLFSVLAVSKREDRASRHNHNQIDPFVDITITRPGD